MISGVGISVVAVAKFEMETSSVSGGLKTEDGNAFAIDTEEHATFKRAYIEYSEKYNIPRFSAAAARIYLLFWVYRERQECGRMRESA